MLNEYFLIGEIVKPQGITGEMKVKPFSDDLDNLTQIRVFYFLTGDSYTLQKAKSVRIYDRFLYLVLEGVTTREGAEALRGKKLYIHRSQGTPLSEEEFYIVDLVGCKVVDSKHNPLGELVEVLQPGGLDVYVVQTPKGKMMLPALLSAIPQVNIQEKWIMLNEDKLGEVAVFED